jgi:hypothetical protein
MQEIWKFLKIFGAVTLSIALFVLLIFGGALIIYGIMYGTYYLIFIFMSKYFDDFYADTYSQIGNGIFCGVFVSSVVIYLINRFK